MSARASKSRLHLVLVVVALPGLGFVGPASGQLCSEDFRVAHPPGGGLTLVGGSGAAAFGPNDLPRWPEPFIHNRSTGITARSLSTNIPPIEVLHYEPAGTTAGPGSVVTMPYETLCLPAYGGAYELAPRMQLGHGYLGIPYCCAGPWPVGHAFIAEDFYVFDPRRTPCVRYCQDTGCSPAPGLPPAGQCEIGCADCVGDCGMPDTCPATGGMHDMIEDFSEDVAFFEMHVRFAAMPETPELNACGQPSCCELASCDDPKYEVNPISAQVYVDAWVEDASHPSGGWWFHQKAGTEFRFGSRTPWENWDACTQADLDANDWTSMGCPGPPPPVLPEILRQPRLGIRFPIPAQRRIRVYGDVVLPTCEGPVSFDIVELLWPAEYAGGARHHEYGPTEVPPGTVVDETRCPDQTDPLTSKLVTKLCDLDCDDARHQPPRVRIGHGPDCCGPEWVAVHGEMGLLEPYCARSIRLDRYDFSLETAGNPVRMGGMSALQQPRWSGHPFFGRFFSCLPVLENDPDLIPDPAYDPSCAFDTSMPRCPAPELGCLHYGEWRTTYAPNPDELTANYRTVATAFEGDWYSTTEFQAVLEAGKNWILMPRIKGLHGLLMDEDPRLCESEILADPLWSAPWDYPNFEDIRPDIDRMLSSSENPCWSRGLRLTNVDRLV